jgi:hypothetical protein
MDVKFEESVHADVSCYKDDDGNFDMMKFIKSVDTEIAEKNKQQVRYY